MATKRGVLSFGLMVKLVTGEDPLDYNGYGCYCGIGGEGKPVDDLDRWSNKAFFRSSLLIFLVPCVMIKLKSWGERKMYCPFHFENHRIKSNDGITSFK